VEKDEWGHLVNTVINFGYRKILAIYWVVEQMSASEEGFSFIEIVNYILTKFSLFDPFLL
jgi:hypothetical protein